jgi:hypothetical protein
MNVQVVDGSGTTDGTVNGLGNLIVGYNENAYAATRTGSHNLVVGPDHEYTSYAGLVGGRANTISGGHASVSGGWGNSASGLYSSISGGYSNIASDQSSSVNGGSGNAATGLYSSVSGGLDNTASGQNSSVSAGSTNTASGLSSSVSGGNLNEATVEGAAVSGGRYNTASGLWATVSGGESKEAAALYSKGTKPDYDSGWVPTGSGTNFTLTHDLGGDADDYVVELWFKAVQYDTIYGTHSMFYGNDNYNMDGAGWNSLTNTQIEVERAVNDRFVDEFRVQIWKNQ